ncbi:NADH dehydrogenase [Paramicrobacterium humi]|uniref:NADH dehydrogenase n=1 Tax=Paramicrobacterium humi TaxID=640635 RepID=A0A1H4TT44_9MICO|nr:NAD(P)/FAD-dependent oxidoreductase [Microbacterium humi]SEC59672.1 NADH dehydrogenase [Microbacterium humi]
MKDSYQVIIVGGGFAGISTARELGRKGIDVLLIDKNTYHQFQPLLYQVASSQIGVSEVARPIRSIFRRYKSVKVLHETVTSIDAKARSVVTDSGRSLSARILVIAAGAVPNFFNTTGAEEQAFPLYSVADAIRLGTKIDEEMNAAAPEPDSAVDVLVIGGGPTGVETAGAIAENIRYVYPGYYSPEFARRCTVHLVDMIPKVLAPFSEQSQAYTAERLKAIGVRLHLGTGVSEVRDDGVTLADDSQIPGQIVVWAGGLKAGQVITDSGLTTGRGGRVDVTPELTAPDIDGVYVLGDSANIVDARGDHLPQLGSVAQQSGKWAAKNIIADLQGLPRTPFGYVDKGYMAMIGRGAAVAEIGRRRIRMKGFFAYMAWLLVHVALLSGTRQKVGAVVSWTQNYLTNNRSHVVLDPQN